MANSIIEDVLNDPINESGNGKNTKTSKPKKSNKVIIIFLIILLIIIACIVGAIFYLQNMATEVSSKSAFFEYLSSNNLESVTEFSSYEKLIDRLLEENSETETNIDISYESEDLSISGIELILNSESDVENSKNYINAIITYSDNNLFEFEILTSDDSIALKSDEVVTAYVDIPYEYIYSYVTEGTDILDVDIEDSDVDADTDDVEYTNNALEEVGTTEILVTTTDDSNEEVEDEIDETTSEDTTYTEDTANEVNTTTNDTTNSTNTSSSNTTSNTSITEIEEIVKSIENISLISNESIEIYENILDKNLDETHFSSSSTGLSLDSGTVSATGYILTMTETEFISIAQQCLEALETDTDTIEAISGLLTILGLSEEEFVDSIDVLIAELDEYELQGNNIVISIYESEGETVKILVEYAGMELEIQYEYGSSENSVKVTYSDENQSGGYCKITNTVSDLSNQINIDLSIAEENTVYASITVSANLVGSGNTYTLDSGIYYQNTDSDSLDIVITNEIEFTEDIEVEDLTDENSVSIEDLSDEQLTEIYEQLQSVLNNKISQLSFIDTNSSSTVIDQNGNDEEDENEKEELQNILVSAIQEEMTIALENNEEYTIQNLVDLEIEGYTVSVILSVDIATIDINGYTFYIDSSFTLTD